MLTVNKKQSVVEYFVDLLSERLQGGQRVLWLISGGSAIELEAEIAHQLHQHDTQNLTVALMDERYGAIGHANENWQKLLDAGFALPNAHAYRTLVGANRSHTTKQFIDFITKELARADYTVGLFGMGADGHTAGIKPHSAGITDEALAVDYTGDDFERITITTEAIKQLNEAVLYVKGREKEVQIERLLHKTIDVRVQPAQILKLVPKSTLFVAI